MNDVLVFGDLPACWNASLFSRKSRHHRHRPLSDSHYDEPWHMFTWKPIYKEIARALMFYRERHAELLDIVKEMQQAGLPAISLKDQNPAGTEVDLGEIDPFTFFANFNRGITDDSRREMLRIIRKEFEIALPIPTDFHGIPVANQLKAWFFPYAHRRDPADVPALWDLAQACLDLPPQALDADLFSRCLHVKQVAGAKLTMGLFWLNPDNYLAVDSLMCDYLEDKGISGKRLKVKSLADYTSVLQEVRQKVGTDYAQVSRDAYLHANKVPATPAELDAGLASLLQQTAQQNNTSVEDVVAYMAHRAVFEEENEIINRVNVMPRLADVLASTPLDQEELRRVSSKLWALGGSQDSTRRGAFFKSGAAVATIAALLDDSDGSEEMERIDNFIAAAVQHGYTDPKGADTTCAAQFASVLMSARYPDRYVDFRTGRWNGMFELVTGSKKKLCTGGSNAWKIIRAGKFAAMLAETPTFKKHFGTEHGLWKAAGVAWCYKDGIFEMPNDVVLPPLPPTPPPRPKPISPNVILYGPPGTGKTYHCPHKAVGIIDGEDLRLTTQQLQQRFDELIDEGRISFVTFHQSYSYEDFVEGIRPVLNKDKEDGPARYECRDGVFKRIAIEALRSSLERIDAAGAASASAAAGSGASYDERKGVVLEYLKQRDASGYRLQSPNKSPRYVLVIDEINRGNISKILGELVTLLEPDKRIGADRQLRAQLPYSGEVFGVPQNLFVLGTMNTADKSIALVDVALRRRFDFQELMPNLDCCQGLTPEMRGVLEKLNARIVRRKDRDHQIGHSYFMTVTTVEQFNKCFRDNIIPLLQEYFYNDWDGLRYVFAEEGGEDGRFIRRLEDSGSKWVRNKWQWFTDMGDKALDCLGQLLKNYDIVSETADDES